MVRAAWISLVPRFFLIPRCWIAARPAREDSHHHHDELGSHTQNANLPPQQSPAIPEYNRLS